MPQVLFLSLSSSLGIAFFLRHLSHWLVLISLIGYQLLFPAFIVPSLFLFIYSLCAIVLFIDALVVLSYEENSSKKFPTFFLLSIDSLFLFSLISILGTGGLHLLFSVALLQIVAFSFYQNKSSLIKFVLWISFLFSLGFLWQTDMSPSQGRAFFLLFNISLGVGFIIGNSLISFLKENFSNHKIVPFSSFSRGKSSTSSLSLALHLSNRFKPALHSLLEFFERSLSEKEDFSKRKEDISYQIRQLTQLQNLTQELNQLEKREELSLQSVNVNEIIQRSIQNLLSHPERPSFLKETLELHSEGWIKGSASHLERVCKEILINSFQSLKKNSSPEIKIKTYTKDNEMFLEFLDNGQGVNKEDIPYLLEPLFSKRLGKSGLGLSFVFKIIKAHKGWVEVHNRSSQQGLKVLIHLPLPRKNPFENQISA